MRGVCYSTEAIVVHSIVGIFNHFHKWINYSSLRANLKKTLCLSSMSELYSGSQVYLALVA